MIKRKKLPIKKSKTQDTIDDIRSIAEEIIETIDSLNPDNHTLFIRDLKSIQTDCSYITNEINDIL